jgi:hypothetical protein
MDAKAYFMNELVERVDCFAKNFRASRYGGAPGSGAENGV